MRMLDLDEVDVQGRTALHVASHMGHADVVLLLRGAYEEEAPPSWGGGGGAEAGGTGAGEEDGDAVAAVGAAMAGLSVADTRG